MYLSGNFYDMTEQYEHANHQIATQDQVGMPIHDESLVNISYDQSSFQNNGEEHDSFSNDSLKKIKKSLIGCYTCRKKKKQCDKKKPGCDACSESNIPCGGYEIKLRWRKSIQFNTYGDIILNPKDFKLLDSNNKESIFQRRRIKFLRYKEEYKYYDQMDDELTELNRVLKSNKEKLFDNKTWIIKKFGVLWGDHQKQTKFMSKFIKKQPRKKTAIKKPTKNVAKKVQRNDSVQQQPDSGSEHLFNLDFNFNHPLGTEWISEELRDDAIVSATATAATAQFSIANNNNMIMHQSQFFQAATPSVSQMTPQSHDSSTFPLTGNRHNNIASFFASSNEDNLHMPLDDQHKINSSENIYSVLFHKNTMSPAMPVHQYEAATATNKSNSSLDESFQNNIVLLGESVGVKTPSVEVSLPSEILHVTTTNIPSEVLNELPLYYASNETQFIKYIPTTGLTTNGLLRFLLNYYLENMVDLMTVIPIPNNPWRKIYFPRAVKALGELVGIGYTSNSGNCLLNALLAVSCFNIQSKFPKESETRKFFLQLGIKFRTQAVSYLELCLNTSFKQEKYKNLLTAILSMNTIDIVWGTMGDCNRHLTICEGFILKRLEERPKISEKARTLHKIFSFLKLIQNSTSLNNIDAGEISILDEDMNSTKNTPQESQSSSGKTDTNLKFHNINSINSKSFQVIRTFTTDSGTEFSGSTSTTHSSPQTPLYSHFKNSEYMSAYQNSEEKSYNIDDLYGLPNSLILLFSDCVNLVRHKMYYKQFNINPPKRFDNICKKFEKELFKWKSEWNFYKFTGTKKEFLNDVVEALYHHQTIFYNAIIIYYFTIVREISNTILDNFCGLILQHCELLLRCIQNKNVQIVPVIWGAFIGACSATDQKQHQYKQWFQDLADSNKFSKYWLSRQIMMEVYRRREKGENDSWISVINEWGVNIMLM